MVKEYKFRNTEINNKKAHDYETKSLLYLIGRRKDSKEIEYVTFDCFNDVSGVNRNSDKIWDIQSKNEKQLNPKKIGKYLYTLFDNFLSSLHFQEFIFFCPPLKDAYKINPSLRIYGINNIQEKTLDRIQNGLREEIKRVRGDSTDYSKKQKDFLEKVFFVEDEDQENEYVKSVTKFKNVDLKTDAFYKSVFQELRDIQSSKKNTYIENSVILKISEVLKFKRHLYTKNIETLIISRIIGCEIFEYKAIPVYFSPLLDGRDIEDRKDILQDCNSNLSKAFYNKNCNKVFWNLCETLIDFLEKNDSNSIEDVFIQLFPNYKPKISYLTPMTVQYLIAIILEGKK